MNDDDDEIKYDKSDVFIFSIAIGVVLLLLVSTLLEQFDLWVMK